MNHSGEDKEANGRMVKSGTKWNVEKRGCYEHSGLLACAS